MKTQFNYLLASLLKMWKIVTPSSTKKKKKTYMSMRMITQSMTGVIDQESFRMYLKKKKHAFTYAIFIEIVTLPRVLILGYVQHKELFVFFITDLLSLSTSNLSSFLFPLPRLLVRCIMVTTVITKTGYVTSNNVRDYMF